MGRPKFLVDRMLGRLVAWLRIFDYDTESALELTLDGDEDAGLIRLARAEGRALLTRDRALVEHATKSCVPAVLIQPDDVKDQLCELAKHYPLETEPIMERCTSCNALLRKATVSDMERIRNAVPPHLIEEDKEFWVCDQCKKIYWQGSHWRNIKKMSEELNLCRSK